jgi:hypothetical protein
MAAPDALAVRRAVPRAFLEYPRVTDARTSS